MYIAIEGCDGVGKTTIRDALAKLLKFHGHSVITIGQHSWLDPESTEIIVNTRDKRRAYNKDLILKAYLKDKIMHSTNNVDPNNDDCIIIADRCYISDIIYLSQLYHLDSEKIRMMHFIEKYTKPDIYVYIYTDVEVAHKRVLSRSKHTKHYEEPVSMKRIISGYLNYFKKHKSFYKNNLLAIDNTDKNINEKVIEIYNYITDKKYKAANDCREYLSSLVKIQSKFTGNGSREKKSYEKIKKFIFKNIPRKKIECWDFACGIAEPSNWFENYTGIDINPFLTKKLKNNVNFINANTSGICPIFNDCNLIILFLYETINLYDNNELEKTMENISNSFKYSGLAKAYILLDMAKIENKHKRYNFKPKAIGASSGHDIYCSNKYLVKNNTGVSEFTLKRSEKASKVKSKLYFHSFSKVKRILNSFFNYVKILSESSLNKDSRLILLEVR